MDDAPLTLVLPDGQVWSFPPAPASPLPQQTLNALKPPPERRKIKPTALLASFHKLAPSFRHEDEERRARMIRRLDPIKRALLSMLKEIEEDGNDGVASTWVARMARLLSLLRQQGAGAVVYGPLTEADTEVMEILSHHLPGYPAEVQQLMQLLPHSEPKRGLHRLLRAIGRSRSNKAASGSAPALPPASDGSGLDGSDNGPRPGSRGDTAVRSSKAWAAENSSALLENPPARMPSDASSEDYESALLWGAKVAKGHAESNAGVKGASGGRSSGGQRRGSSSAPNSGPLAVQHSGPLMLSNSVNYRSAGEESDYWDSREMSAATGSGTRGRRGRSSQRASEGRKGGEVGGGLQASSRPNGARPVSRPRSRGVRRYGEENEGAEGQQEQEKQLCRETGGDVASRLNGNEVAWSARPGRGVARRDGGVKNATAHAVTGVTGGEQLGIQALQQHAPVPGKSPSQGKSQAPEEMEGQGDSKLKSQATFSETPPTAAASHASGGSLAAYATGPPEGTSSAAASAELPGSEGAGGGPGPTETPGELFDVLAHFPELSEQQLAYMDEQELAEWAFRSSVLGDAMALAWQAAGGGAVGDVDGDAAGQENEAGGLYAAGVGLGTAGAAPSVAWPFSSSILHIEEASDDPVIEEGLMDPGRSASAAAAAMATASTAAQIAAARAAVAAGRGEGEVSEVEAQLLLRQLRLCQAVAAHTDLFHKGGLAAWRPQLPVILELPAVEALCSPDKK